MQDEERCSAWERCSSVKEAGPGAFLSVWERDRSVEGQDQERCSAWERYRSVAGAGSRALQRPGALQGTPGPRSVGGVVAGGMFRPRISEVAKPEADIHIRYCVGESGGG